MKFKADGEVKKFKNKFKEKKKRKKRKKKNKLNKNREKITYYILVMVEVLVK